MTGRSPDWSTLNAYVDGQLDPRAAAAVADSAGRDPAVAEDIATLYRLKGTAQDVFPAPPPDFSPEVPPVRRRLPVVWIAVASLAAAAVVAIALFLPKVSPSVLPADALSTARDLHADWLVAEPGDAEEASLTLMEALGHFRQVPVIPDLESARLTITRVRLSEPAGKPVLQVGYRGVHDCHLSLFVFTSAGMPETMVRVDVGPERAYGWRVSDLDYLLFARGMDKRMLDLIAHKVEEETRTRTPFDQGTRNLLAARKSQSSSCVT